MDIYNEMISTMANSIVDAINKQCNNSYYDKTYTGIITEVLDNNKYKVQFNGAVYTAPSIFKDIPLYVNDNVFVIVLKNAWNFIYIIPNRLNTKTNKYSIDIGNNSASTFLINHNLYTEDIVVNIIDNTTKSISTASSIIIVDKNTIQVSFSTIPSQNKYKVVIIG